MDDFKEVDVVEKLLEVGKHYAATMFNPRGAKDSMSFPPTWFMWSEDDGGKLVLAATPWGDDKDKAEVLGRLKEHMRKNNVTTFCMVSEAWLSSFNIEDPRAKQLMTGEIKPSQDDCGREVISVIVVCRDGRYKGGEYFILRPEHRDTADLSDFHPNPDNTIGVNGIMMGMLP